MLLPYVKIYPSPDMLSQSESEKGNLSNTLKGNRCWCKFPRPPNNGLGLPHTDAFFMQRVASSQDASRRGLNNIVFWEMYLTIKLTLNHAIRRPFFQHKKISESRNCILTQRNATHEKRTRVGQALMSFINLCVTTYCHEKSPKS